MKPAEVAVPDMVLGLLPNLIPDLVTNLVPDLILSLAHIWSSGTKCGTKYCHLVAFKRFEAVLERPGAVLEPTWTNLELIWSPLELTRRQLEQTWANLDSYSRESNLRKLQNHCVSIVFRAFLFYWPLQYWSHLE